MGLSLAPIAGTPYIGGSGVVYVTSGGLQALLTGSTASTGSLQLNPTQGSGSIHFAAAGTFSWPSGFVCQLDDAVNNERSTASFNCNWSPPTANKSFDSIYLNVETPAALATNITTMRGLGAFCNHYGTGTVVRMMGALAQGVSRGVSTVTFCSGINGVAGLASTGTITEAASFHVPTNDWGIIAFAGTIGTLYGMKIGDLANTGTITNTYGIYIGDLTAGTQTNTPFGLYVSDAGVLNYFAGSVGIGTATPDSPLHVVGNIKCTSLTIDAHTEPFIASSPNGTDTWIGVEAGLYPHVNTGGENVGLGYIPLNSITSGTANVAIGGGAMLSTTSGSSNVGIGRHALWGNTVGHDNVAIGEFSMDGNVVAFDMGDYNVAVGSGTLLINAGDENVAIGHSTLRFNTSGHHCVGVGSFALDGNTTGTYNTSVGSASGVTNTIGSSNTFVGVNSGNTDGVVSTPANLQEATAIGAFAQVTVSNAVVLGGTGAHAVNVGIGITAPTARLHVVGDVIATGRVSAPTGGELTIATGVVTATASFHTIDTESDAATDDLTTINGGTAGMILRLRLASAARVVTIKNGTGNIFRDAGDFVFSGTGQYAELLCVDGSNWVMN